MMGSRKLRIGMACLVGIVYLFFLTGSVYEAVVFPQFPQEVTLARAVELDLKNKPDFLPFDKTLYVSITDAVWECASVKQTGYKTIFSDKRRTDAVFTDAQKTAVVFIQLDGFFDCEYLKAYRPLGELQYLDSRPIIYQSDTTGKTTLDVNSDILVYRFCTHCTPSNAVLVSASFVLFPLFIWGYYQYKKHH